MTGRLREELERIGESAPVAAVDPDTWGRARRARQRERVLVLVAVVAVLAASAGLVTWLPTRDDPPIAGSRGVVPDHIHVVTSTREVPVTTDLAVGRTAAAYVATVGVHNRVVTIAATNGRYHVLDLPRFAERAEGENAAAPAPIALSPDGTQLAYAYAGQPSLHSKQATPTGLTVVDLASGRSRSIPLAGGKGILVRAISWSPDSRWLVWNGQVSTVWDQRGRQFGARMAAGRIAPGADRSGPVPASASTDALEAFGIDDSGRVAISSDHRFLIWDDAVVAETQVPRGSGSPLDIVDGSNPLADVRTAAAGRGRTAWHVLRWSGTDQGPRLESPDVRGVAMAVRGWLGDTPVVETQPLRGGWTSTSLDLLTDRGLREIGRIDDGVLDLTLASDLMSRAHPTAAVPAPDWVDSGTSPWVGLGAGVLALLVAGGLVAVRRRRQVG